MISMSSSSATELITFLVEPGEMLLETIKEAIAEYDIKNGVVISGIGTLKTCTLHYITHCGYPPEEAFPRFEAPLEVSGISGLIANYEPHLHMVVSKFDEKVWGGHLEENCEVAYLAEIAILKCNDLSMKREFVSPGVKLLRKV